MPAAAAAEPFDSPRSLCGGGGIQLSTPRLSAYDVQAGDYLSYNKTGMGRLPNVAGLDVTVDYVWLTNIMDISKALACPLSSKANDGALAQNEVGIFPVKLLLLALSATRLFITSHVVDGKFPVNKLLEMFSTCRGRSWVEDGRSLKSPVR
uniref:Uncharacterized protein n=2 Tax=Oryza TaxID=4527 RepID=A0A0E0G1C5_ORYNI